MKNNDQFSSSYDSPFDGPNPDVPVADGFRAKITSLLRFALLSPIEALLPRVKSVWRVFYAKPTHRLTHKKENLLNERTRVLAKAEKLQRQLDSNEIPETLTGRTSFEPPAGFWARVVFSVLLVIGGTAPILEGINFAWFLRFFTDSFLLGLVFAVPVFFVPVAEGAYLLILQPGERVRKLVASAQALLVLVSGLAYTFLSLISSDGSIASVFAEKKPLISLDAWRIGCQLIASVSISALCLHSAFALGALTPTVNKLRAVRERELEDMQQHATSLKSDLGETEGDLEQAEAVKEDAILFCTQKHDQINAVREQTTQVIKEQL